MLIPQENEKDLADIPANIKEGLEIIPVSHVDQVLARALVSPLVAVEWTEADELAAALPPTVGGENGASVTHKSVIYRFGLHIVGKTCCFSQKMTVLGGFFL